jgi:outer membrane protein OmpA-like peptidoglycan-associated protein
MHNAATTPFAARQRVDIHGCPVDSDFDNVDDFADSCPHSPVGAQVDQQGCPIDTDKDGVPEGLDDCPHTLPGVAVDQHGCIDLSMLSKPMVLNIDYEPGSFEVDPHSRARIERLAGLLNFVPDIRLDINGYTDDIGAEVANRTLSEKRANRVKGILTSLGVDPERIKAYGKGESDFVASNQTAEAGQEPADRTRFHK